MIEGRGASANVQSGTIVIPPEHLIGAESRHGVQVERGRVTSRDVCVLKHPPRPGEVNDLRVGRKHHRDRDAPAGRRELATHGFMAKASSAACRRGRDDRVARRGMLLVERDNTPSRLLGRSSRRRRLARRGSRRRACSCRSGGGSIERERFNAGLLADAACLLLGAARGGGLGFRAGAHPAATTRQAASTVTSDARRFFKENVRVVMAIPRAAVGRAAKWANLTWPGYLAGDFPSAAHCAWCFISSSIAFAICSCVVPFASVATTYASACSNHTSASITPG